MGGRKRGRGEEENKDSGARDRKGEWGYWGQRGGGQGTQLGGQRREVWVGINKNKACTKIQ